jgi:RNA polymerase sigma-70 factor (ECF subfamily)
VDLDLSRIETPAPRVERETRLSLVRALDGLREEHRIPLRLAYFGGLSYEETALRLNLPVGTLKSRIRAALAQMRQALE